MNKSENLLLVADSEHDANMLYATDPETGETYVLDRDEEPTVTLDCNWRPNGGTYVTKAMQAARDADAAAARKAKMQIDPPRRDLRFRPLTVGGR